MISKSYVRNFTDKGEVVIEFLKKDGSTRLMRCTTDYKSLSNNPAFIPPKGTKQNTEAPNIVRVWDVEKEDFRSIIIENIQKIITNKNKVVYLEIDPNEA